MPVLPSSILLRIGVVLLGGGIAVSSVRAADSVHSTAATLPLTAAQRARLDAFHADFRQALMTNKPDSVERYFDTSLRLMPSYQRTVLGVENAMRYYRAFLQRFEVRAYDRRAVEVLDLGSQVAEFGEFTMALATRSTGTVQMLSGKYLELWVKTDAEKLRLITTAWNYDQQAENGDDFRFSDVPAVQMAFAAHLPVNTPIRFELAGLNLLVGQVVSQHDAKLWSQFFADDAVLSANYVPTARGRAEIDRYLEDHVKGLPIFEHLDIRNDRIDVTGKYVIEYASHVANWRNGDSSGVSTGKNIRLWRREPGGELRMIRQIGAYD